MLILDEPTNHLDPRHHLDVLREVFGVKGSYVPDPRHRATSAPHPRPHRRHPQHGHPHDDDERTPAVTFTHPPTDADHQAPTTTRIGILFFPGVEELDAAGPWEVLAFWAGHVATSPVQVVALGLDDEPVTCAKGLRVLTEEIVTADTPLDVLVHPGGLGTRPLALDPGHLELVRAQADRGTLMTSVCTGSLVYAAAGLLRNRRATTHWRATDQLAELDPTITILDQRWVDEGAVVTSAGVSAGIDMALHLIDRLDSPDVTDEVARGIQYDHWNRALAS